VETGIGVQGGVKPEYRVQISKPAIIPNFIEGKDLIDRYVEGKSTRNEERMKRLEEIAKIKAAADKAAADKAATIKKKTITCIKGKTTKKVTAVKPKCPAGYKKK
jgi:hypothetical protein